MKLQRFLFALCAAGAATSAAVAHADTWTTLNADGSVTKTEMNAAGQVKSMTTTPVAPIVRSSGGIASFTARDSRSGDNRWDNDRDDDRNHNRDRRNHRHDQNAYSVYPYYGGYVQSYPYSFQLPGFAPFGGPVISVLPQPGIQSYPAYPAYGYPVPANPYPVYSYPYPVYNYPSYPAYGNPYGNGTYGSSSTYGGITLGSGGLNVTIGGSRTRTQTSTSIWDQ